MVEISYTSVTVTIEILTILLYKNFEQARGEKKCRGIATPSVKLSILSNLCLWYSMGQSEAIGHSNDNSNNRGFLK